MGSPIPHYDPVGALRTAYQQLPEDTKRRVCRAMYQTKPADFGELSRRAKTGYHNIRTAAERPPGVGYKLDQYFLRAQSGYVLLRRATSSFFFTEKLSWVDHVRLRVLEENSATVARKVEQILLEEGAPWRGDPLEAYFSAASLANPTDWLPEERVVPLSGVHPPALPAIPPANVATQEPWQRIWNDFVQAEKEAVAILDVARAARPIDVSAFTSQVSALARTGEALRAELAKIADAASETRPDWKTAAELKGELERLSVVIRTARTAKSRQHLLDLAAAIERLVDIGSRTAAKRAEVEKTRTDALAELRTKAADPSPAMLPAPNASPWLDATFALSTEALDRHLRELEQAGFPKLSAFIVAAEALDRFAPPKASSPQPMVAVPEQVVAADVPQQKSSAEAANIQVGAPSEDAGETTRDGEAESAAQPRSPTPALAPESAAALRACIEALCEFDAIDDARVLLPDIIEAQSTEVIAQLPAVELWRSIACQPWLAEKESDVHEMLRRDLQTLVDPVQSEAEAVLVWAAAVYPAFLGATSQANGLIFALTQSKWLPNHFVAFTRHTAAFLEAVPHCSPEGILTGTMHSDWADSLEVLRGEITQFCDSAAQQTLNYQKATLVWKKLNATGGRLREIAQRTAGKPTKETIKKLQGEASELLNPRVQQRLIESVGRSLNSNFPNIDGAALEQLLVRFDEFARRINRFCDHALREPKESHYFTARVREFSSEALPLLRSLPSPDPGSKSLTALAYRIARRAALRVTSLFELHSPRGPAELPYSDALELARLRVSRLPLVPRSFAIAEDDEDLVREAFHRDNFLPIEDATRRRLAAGELAAARRLLERMGPRGLTTDWTVSLEEAREKQSGASLHELEAARRDVLNARTLGVMSDSDAQVHLTRLAAAEAQTQTGDDFAAPLRTIRQIKAQLHEVTLQEAKKLGDELAKLPAHPAETRERVRRLLDSGDLATAREYITRLKSNKSLPPLGLEEPLAGFTLQKQAQISAALASAHEFDGFISKVQSRGEFADVKFDSFSPQHIKEVVEWLQAWRGMRVGNSIDRDLLMRWLAGAGFRPLDVRLHHAGSEIVADIRTEVIANRAVCPVYHFGSEAKGNYRLVHLTKRQDGTQYLQILRQAGASQAVMLLAAYRVEPQVRLEFARICRENRIRGLLIDDVLVTYLAQISSGRLGALFRATLPYTWVDPFVPTWSSVPPEMFFGREDPLDALLDMSKQRCFVYGGRQLGKTALLREVERRFPAQYDAGVGLWIDLHAEDFGSKVEPEEIWKLLNERFCEKVPGYEVLWGETKGSQHGRFESALSKWLNKQQDRRLLLLLDESDGFLDRDAVRDFAETRRLKDIMGRWRGRVKIVFAGLHNVQRSTRQANHPLAHLGVPINVGAFSQNGEWMEAYALVAGPLAALGFKFESAELPSRVLAACNFYPSLLQQFGHRLLERFRNHPGIPRLVNADDIDAVLREDEFRRFMTDRFQLTLQLDRRYYYIAYAFALFFHTEPGRATQGYNSGELRDKMEYWRPAEFASINHEEFDSLLDEMLGLGVLQRGDDQRYRLRNTNVLLLLGTSDEVLRRLSEDIPESRIDYQSQTHRARLSENRRRLLTRPEENRLLDRTHRLNLVSCPPVAESATIEESLRASAGHDRFFFVPASTPDSVRRELEEIASKKLEEGTYVVMLDHRQKDSLKCDQTIELAREFVNSRSSKVRFFSVAVHVPVGQLWRLEMRSAVNATDVHLFLGRQWEQEFVGPWLQDQSLSISTNDVAELMAVTDGWPRLLHGFADEHRAKNSWAEALESVRRRVDRWAKEPGGPAKFVGEGADAATAWTNLRQLYGMDPGAFSSADITPFAELLNVQPALMQHWIDVASRLGLLERTGQTYRWGKVISRVLAG